MDPLEKHENSENVDASGVLSVHFGRSANCSSLGSVVDFLFVSSAVGAALVSSVAILLVPSNPKQDEEE